ncbi:winged helix-turn-helix domain-containing protein [Natranaerobius thermophilus]|uniref:Putative transcriptional regulator, ModE family n=1 Tax=Natranaerobius thermophilus (strain ATCC BAA-1301 / DSM 18059 / JW/NM-WN-LF) TaxID=457570 RepID=B2A7Z6_NATTJ|nr:LysR family transcriptional regulator [Natranaerobius thermophilus]ACB85768.1 putative transcriptional regulator, ModE family [Natranaerobius thermophilus JW/NM-WN-LF]
MKYKVYSKVWLENQNGRVFGDGPAKLLEYIEELGSLRKAAGHMEMSYSQALNIIKMIEENLGKSVIFRKTGGPEGGGSFLTEHGKELLEKYRAFRSELTASMEQLYEKHFH